MDLADATTETAKKARARFFEQSKQAFRGRLTKEELGVIRTSNEAVHHGNIVADRALMKLGLGNYADEFLRLYEYTVEESFRFGR